MLARQLSLGLRSPYPLSFWLTFPLHLSSSLHVLQLGRIYRPFVRVHLSKGFMWAHSNRIIFCPINADIAFPRISRERVRARKGGAKGGKEAASASFLGITCCARFSVDDGEAVATHAEVGFHLPLFCLFYVVSTFWTSKLAHVWPLRFFEFNYGLYDCVRRLSMTYVIFKSFLQKRTYKPY